MTRRGFLAASAAGLTLAAGGRVALPLRRARGANQADYDIIVIGGGFAGVTAGRELPVAGHSVLLLEAMRAEVQLDTELRTAVAKIGQDECGLSAAHDLMRKLS